MSMSGQTLNVEKIGKNNPPTSLLSLSKNKNIIEYDRNNSFYKAFAKLKERKEFSSVFLLR